MHPDWDVVIQAYEVRSITSDGLLAYASDFTLYRPGTAVPADFTAYPKTHKQQLWEIIFAIKQRFLDEVQPDIVEHFIKAPYRVGDRLALYQQHLDLTGYAIERTNTTFTFVRL